MRTIETELKARVIAIIDELYGIRLDHVTVEIPPRPAFGDIALPIAFELAKQLKQSTGEKQVPRRLAETIASRLGQLEGLSRIDVAGPGYINIFLDRPRYLRALLEPIVPPQPSQDKLIVEHTSVNPNKAAHIGHLRNAVLGDALVRLLRALGQKVEVQNYIDNTGVQVADVVVGFKYLEKKSLDEIQRITGKFDDYCWDLYARVTEWYDQNPDNLAYRRQTLQEIEIEDHPTARMADYISMRVLNHHLDTMDRLGIRYDVLPRESDILHCRFWDRAFEILKQAGVIVYETEGRNKGCWVMRATAGDRQTSSTSSEDEYSEDKILVRSDGTVNYTGKDIAYHLWKLGKLGIDFNYKPFRSYPDRHQTWITTAEASEATRITRPIFGFGSAYLNVIGSEQTYPQKVVKQAIAAVASDVNIERCVHVAYEKVALSPRACMELGIELKPEERERQQISMSGRRGLGVKADELIDKLEQRAVEEVRSRHPDLQEPAQREIAHLIAVGALRYFLLKYTRTSVITFDFDDALSFDGETGPYIQYAIVRAQSIFRKLDASGIRRGHLAEISDDRLTTLLSGERGDDLWSLIYLAGRLDDTVRQASENLEPALLAKYTFQLAQRFNLFYHHYHILREPDEARRTLLITVTEVVERQLRRALDLMGIGVPEKM